MGKYQKKQKKEPTTLLVSIVVILVIVVVTLALFAMPQLRNRLSGESSLQETAEATVPDAHNVGTGETAEITQPVETAPVTQETVSFPLVLEDGKLEISSLFQFSGINPDSANQEGNDIASIVLKNTSGTYLAEAKIGIVLADGTQLNFAATNLPAGKSAMAFSLENLSIEADAACVSVACDAVYDNIDPATAEQVSVSTDGILITLTNNTGNDISEIVVYCRSPFGEDYFGGVTYQYSVSNLPANRSTTVEAVDCILGIAEVVRVAIK